MRGLKKELGFKVVSFIITLGVLGILVLSGPADAFTIGLNIPITAVEKGEVITFTGEIDINAGEQLNIDNLKLKLSGPENVNCKFYPNGSIISGCKGLSIHFVGTAGFGYGYGYAQHNGNHSFGYGYGYTNGKLTYNFTLNTTDYSHGDYKTKLIVKIKDKEFSQSGVNIKIKPFSPLGLTVSSPVNGSIYEKRRIQLNITTNQEVDKIEYIDWNKRRPKWRRLCKDCDEYGNLRKRFKSFSEGSNDISIRAKANGIKEEINIKFLIDSKKPKITKTEPRSGFADGNFLAQIKEDNPTKLELIYGNDTNKINEDADLTLCYIEKRREKCPINVNLSFFDNNEIKYYFILTDIVNRTKDSRVRKLDVDYSDPIVNSFNYSIKRRRVTFLFDITEANFDEINYKDDSSKNPRWRRLCSRLKKDGTCKKSKGFTRGNHTVHLEVLDDAGNRIELPVIKFEILK